MLIILWWRYGIDMYRPYLDIYLVWGVIYQNWTLLAAGFPFLRVLLSRPVPTCLDESTTCPSGDISKLPWTGSDDNFLISLRNRASDSDWRLSKAATHSVTLVRHGFSGSLTSCGSSHGTAFTKAPTRTIWYCRATAVGSLTQMQADAEHCWPTC